METTWDGEKVPTITSSNIGLAPYRKHPGGCLNETERGSVESLAARGFSAPYSLEEKSSRADNSV